MFKRKITEKFYQAFIANVKFSSRNTKVTVNKREDGKIIVSAYLYDNLIAQKESGANSFNICHGGWKTYTTKERLNGLPGVNITQKNYVWYLNGKEWGGDWTEISL